MDAYDTMMDAPADGGERPSPEERSALEYRADIDSLAELHQQRRTLLVSLNPLKAIHGPFGLYDDLRKQLLEACKIRSRMRLSENKEKVTEGMVDSEAYDDEQYRRFLDQGLTDRIDFLNLENEYNELTERIRSRELELSAYAAEVRLSR